MILGTFEKLLQGMEVYTQEITLPHGNDHDLALRLMCLRKFKPSGVIDQGSSLTLNLGRVGSGASREGACGMSESRVLTGPGKEGGRTSTPQRVRRMGSSKGAGVHVQWRSSVDAAGDRRLRILAERVDIQVAAVLVGSVARQGETIVNDYLFEELEAQPLCLLFLELGVHDLAGFAAAGADRGVRSRGWMDPARRRRTAEPTGNIGKLSLCRGALAAAIGRQCWRSRRKHGNQAMITAGRK